MSDILLSVGMQKGHVGSSQLEIDIKDVVARISKNPPKVSVGLKVDQSALNRFKSQLTQIVNSISLTNGSPITVNISGLGEVSAQAGKAKKALNGVAQSGMAAADAVNKMNGKESANALTRINTLMIQIQANLAKWTAAQVGNASASYEVYNNQLTALAELKLLVEQNSLTAEEFSNKLSEIRAAATGAAQVIKSMGEDHVVQSVERLTKDSDAYNTALGKTEMLLAHVKKHQIEWTSAKNGKSSAAYTALSSYQRELESLINKLMTGEMTADEFAAAFSNISAKVKTAEGTIRSCGENTKTLGDRMKGLAEKFGAWLSVSQVIMMAVRAIKQMVVAVREVDTAMTELKKVTNETDATYNRFLTEACERAKRLGATVSNVVTATADFARLGYNINDASTLADTALIYKNIGDGIDDIAIASESIISTMQAFGIEASNAMSIVDRFNEVGNNFAISSAGIGEAMQRSASAMSSANNTIDETIALITAANTIVQNPESVGTTMKTISMYLRAAKTEAEEAGESTEGMANSVSELREEILDLTGRRVDIQLDENVFKSTYQILKELSEVWDSLTDISQANLLEMIGGKRNANVVSALLENFSVAEKAMKASAESAGSALVENEKHMDSINGKIAIFTASFQTLATTLFDSGFVKGIVDFGTSIIDVLSGIVEMIDSLGGLSTVLLTVSSAFLIAKKGVIAFSAVKGIISIFTKIKSGISNVINIIPNAVAAWKALAAGTASASAAMQASIPVIGLVLSAITLLVAGFSLYNDTVEESRQKTHDNAAAAASLTDEIGKLAAQYISLNSAVAEDASAKESLIDVQNQLIESLGLEQYEIDKLIEKYGSLSDAILKASKDSLNTAEIDLRADINTYKDELKEAAREVNGTLHLGTAGHGGSDTERFYKEIQDASAAYAALESAGYLDATSVWDGSSHASYGEYKGGTVTGAYNVRLVFDWDLQSIDGIMTAYSELDEMLSLVANKAGSTNYIYDGLYEEYKKLSQAINSYNDSIGSLNNNLAQQYVIQELIGKEVPTTRDEFNVYRKSVIDAAVASGEFIGSSEQIGSAIDSVLKKETAFAEFYNSATYKAVKNTQWMKNQIVDTFASQTINMDDYVAHTKSWDIAYAQFSDYCEKYEKKLASLSDIEVEFVFDLVIGEGISSWEEIENRLASFDEDVYLYEKIWNTYIPQISTIISDGDISAIKTEITTLLDALGKLSNGTLAVEDVLELINKFPELVQYADLAADDFGELDNGLRELIKNAPEELIGALQAFKETNNLTGEAAKHIESLCTALEELSNVDTTGVSERFGKFIESLSKIDKLGLGLSQLSTIFNDIKDGGNFNWDTILNDNFEKEFGNLGYSYENFVQTVAKSPKDLAACRSAFNELATAYVLNSGALNGITESNRDAAIAMLEQMGVANAVVLVDEQIAINKERLKYTTDEYTKMTYAEIQALYDEALAGSVAKQALAELAVQKYLLENPTLNTANDVKQLLTLADTANATSESLARIMEAKSLMVSADRVYAEFQREYRGGDPYQLESYKKFLELKEKANEILSTPLEYEPTSMADIMVDFDGIKEDEEAWFEKQYKEHNHLVQMETESDEEYLKWLVYAYEQAYDENIITLDEYRKYQEEAFGKLKDWFKNQLSDIDNEISLLEEAVGNSDEVIALANKAMADIQKQLSLARKAGLDDNSEFIQYLNQQWTNYSQKIVDLQEEAAEEVKSTIDTLVDYRIDMLKQEIESEKEALDKKLDNLQDFYDKQRQMLQDQYDEEKYLEEQNEKRKSVTDIQADLAMLANDNSAWAQKRRLELKEQLAEAQKELSDFEKEHALDVTLSMLDEQQAAQEAAIQAEMDALDEKLNDPEALFNKALNDVKNNTFNLYDAFLNYNRQHGSGNDEDVRKMWEDAYKADQEYRDTHGGQSKDGIQIGNYTGFAWPGAKAPTTTAGTSSSGSSGSYPYGKASDTTGEIGVGARGQSVKAIQYALNQVGFGNSGTKSVDGEFGTGTRNAVIAFQKACGIPADGVVGDATRAKFKQKGYASGTKNATPGIHEVDELGAEYIFTSPSDGSRYRIFTGGEKVLNAKATNFLYDFATTGGSVLSNMLANFAKSPWLGAISKPVHDIQITMGNIIVEGNASEKTVSAIRREQRGALGFMLKELNKLNK